MQNLKEKFRFLEDVASSSTTTIYKPRTETGSSSSSMEAGSSSSTIQDPAPETSSFSRFLNPRRSMAYPSRRPRNYRPARIGRTIIDPNKNDTYLLQNEIGSSSDGSCHVYRALFSEYSTETKELIPSGYVTLKIINRGVFQNECTELQHKINVSEGHSSMINLIGIMNTFETDEFSCVSMPYMSHGSLRYILSSRADKKLPEEFIAIVLKEVLIGLQDELHIDFGPRTHKTLNAGDIFVHIDDDTGEMLIKLAYEATVYDREDINVEGNSNEEEEDNSDSGLFLNPKRTARWGAAPEVVTGPKSDIWLLGITALELAYGELPVRNREELDRIIKKIRKKKRFPGSLEKQLVVKKKKKWRLNLFKEGVFSKKFEKMVRKCLSKKPKKRPTAEQLLKSSFFTIERDMEKFKQFVLNAEKK